MEQEVASNIIWNPYKKVAFQFIFLFFLFFIIIQHMWLFPFWTSIMSYPETLLHQFIPWVGKHILHIQYAITIFTNMSGDTTYDYVIVFVISAIAVFGTVVWSVCDRNRTNYGKLYYWLTVIIRYYVGLSLIRYGLIKIVKTQFPYPETYALTRNLGDFSPMGVAWTFLGLSKGYNLFMGLAEFSGILLLFRRTATAGAIISLMVLANVIAINYFFDVPVKIYSTALGLMVVFLLVNDLRKLFAFFFTGEAVSLPVIKAPIIKKWNTRLVLYLVKFIIIGYFFTHYVPLLYSWQVSQQIRPLLYGKYIVDDSSRTSDTLPIMTTNNKRWRHMIAENDNRLIVKYMDDSTSFFYITMDTVSHKMILDNWWSVYPEGVLYSFQYKFLSANKIQLNGEINGDSVTFCMLRKDFREPGEFPLMKCGFHWINEYPPYK